MVLELCMSSRHEAPASDRVGGDKAGRMWALQSLRPATRVEPVPPLPNRLAHFDGPQEALLVHPKPKAELTASIAGEPALAEAGHGRDAKLP